MDVSKDLRYLKLTLSLFTIILLFTQFYLLSFKLPFELAFNNKSIGFFTLYLNKLTQNWQLGLPLIYFLLAHVAIQTALTLMIYFTTKQLCYLITRLRGNCLLTGIVLWLVAQFTVFCWNGLRYPYSFFSIKFAFIQFWPQLFFIIALLLTVLLLVLFGIAIASYLMRQQRLAILLVSFGIVAFAFTYWYQQRTQAHFRPHHKPNVIIVITDSLQPSYALAASAVKNDPYRIENIAKRSAFFDNAFTLLGRSSPGLVAILTGKYPKNSGARFNLIPTASLRLDNSLTHILKQQGYQTLFLADGRQFINIDDVYGFDQIIAAKGGIYDFIFSFSNDTPLSNLMSNTWLGALLFPYTYANRNAYYTYEPHSFVKLVARKLTNPEPNKPVLLVAALTVAHWPYVWARQPHLGTIAERYENSVTELDQQFSALLRLFKARGLLNNSIVVVLSDHGDSLGIPGDRVINLANFQGDARRLPLIPKAPYTVAPNSRKALIGIDTSAGHGTDLLSLTQLQTTLAFYAPGFIPAKIISERVALIDVTPTLLDLLQIPTRLKFDGLSLKRLIFGIPDPLLSQRSLFLETEIDIPLIDVTKINQHQSAVSALIEQYANLYDIDLTTQQLVLTPAAITRLLTEKQLGVINGDWLLAYFPGKNALDTSVLPRNSSELKNCYYQFPAELNNNRVKTVFCYQLHPTQPYFVLVNLVTHQWRILFNSDLDKDPLFKKMFGLLQGFYPELLS